MKQEELLARITDEELRMSVIYTQLMFIALAIISGSILFEDWNSWTRLFQFSVSQIVFWGIIPGIAIVLIDLLLTRLLPSDYYDDGGINRRVFSNLRVGKLFLLTLLVAVSEELFFRGVIQSSFGYIVASLLFGLIHFRYLKKPVLFVSIMAVSFLLGYIFEVTENVFVTMSCHFIVDFLLGLFIKLKGE